MAAYTASCVTTVKPIIVVAGDDNAVNCRTTLPSAPKHIKNAINRPSTVVCESKFKEAYRSSKKILLATVMDKSSHCRKYLQFEQNIR